MGRAFRELGIEWIAAHSPQAQGRIERCFGTLQDRLVKGLRQVDAKTTEEANRYLEEEFLPQWSERFMVKPGSDVDAHRPLGPGALLESTLSWVEQRQVTNDYTVGWEGRRWQIPKPAVRAGLRRSSIRIEARLNGSLMARIGGQFTALTVCKAAEKLTATATEATRGTRRYVPPAGTSRWMDNFHLRGKEDWKPGQDPGCSRATRAGCPGRRGGGHRHWGYGSRCGRGGPAGRAGRHGAAGPRRPVVRHLPCLPGAGRRVRGRRSD